MKILDILGEGFRSERNTLQSNANILRDLYDERHTVKKELNAARISGDEDEIAELVQQLVDIDADIQQLEDVNLTEQIRYDDLELWKKAAKSRGWVVRSAVHPTSGDSGMYFTAKDTEGNNKGHFDASTLPSTRLGVLKEAKNHMGDREYQTYAGWKAACKKAHPGCEFRGDRDIGAAVVGNKDVGEWDGAIGFVYANTLKESVTDYDDTHSANKTGKTRAELLTIYARTKKSQDRWNARRAGATQLELKRALLESDTTDHREMLRGLTKTLNKTIADLAEMEDDLGSMKSAARTEKEQDAVDDFTKQVEKKRALVERLTKRVKLRKAALGGK